MLKTLFKQEVYIESEVSAMVHKNPLGELFSRGLLGSLMNLIE